MNGRAFAYHPVDEPVTEQSIVLSCTVNKHETRDKIIYIGNGIIIVALAGAIGFNYVSEIEDGLRCSPSSINILPLNFSRLAFLPNTLGPQIVIKGFGAASAIFDISNTAHGIKTTVSMIVNRKLPNEWKQGGLSPGALRCIVITGSAVLLISLTNEIINSLSFAADDNQTQIPSHIPYPILLARICAFAGNTAFVFSEGFRFFDTVIKFFSNQRKKYCKAHEGLSLIVRIPGSAGAMLFAFATSTAYFGVTSTAGKCLVLIFLNFPKGLTDFCYNQEMIMHEMDRFLTFIRKIPKPDGRYPHLSEIFSFGLVTTVMAGTLSFVERQLTQENYQDITSDDTTKTWAINPLIISYSFHLLLYYSFIFYPKVQRVASPIGEKIKAGASMLKDSACSRLSQLGTTLSWCGTTIANQFRKCCSRPSEAGMFAKPLLDPQKTPAPEPAPQAETFDL